MKFVASPLSETDQSSLEIAFYLINKRFEITFKSFVVLISFFIFYLLPTESSIIVFLCFVFFARLLDIIVLFLNIQFHSTSAVTVSNLLLLRANQSVEAGSKNLLPRERLSYDDKINETINSFNQRKQHLELEAFAIFNSRLPVIFGGTAICKVYPKASVWYFEYLLFILPAALGFWMR
jgi:hypothetical protein